MLTSTRPMLPASRLPCTRLAPSLLRPRHQPARLYCMGWGSRSGRLNAKWQHRTWKEIRDRREAEFKEAVDHAAEAGGSWQGSSVAKGNNKARFKMVSRFWKSEHFPGTVPLPDSWWPNGTPENPDGVRPGQNIEDAERLAMEKLLAQDRRDRGLSFHDACAADYFPRDAPEKDLEARYARILARTRPQDVVGCKTRPSKAAKSAEGSGIDPITNRRVPTEKVSAGESNPQDGDTFKAYRSQFSRFAAPPSEKSAIHSDGPPPTEELEKYSQVEIDEIEPAKSTSPASLTAESSLPATEEELQKYSKKSVSPEQPGSRTVELKDYTKAWGYQVAEEKATQVEEPLPEPEELAKYKKTWGYDDTNAKSVETEGPVCDQAELDGYKGKNGWGYDESKGKPMEVEEPVCDQAELNKYKNNNGWGYDESAVKELKAGEAARNQAELDKYRGKNGWGYNDAKGRAAVIIDQNKYPTCDQGELEKYNRDWGYFDLDGSPNSAAFDRGTDPLKEYDESPENAWASGKPAQSDEVSSIGSKSIELPACNHAELEKYRSWGYDDQAGSLNSAAYDRGPDPLKEYDESPENAWVNGKPAQSGEVSSVIPESTEQLASRRTDSEDMDIDTLRASDVRASMGMSADERWISALKEACGMTEPVPLESALTRQARKPKMTQEELDNVLKDPYSKVPQGLETSFAEENGGLETLPVIKRTYMSPPKRVDEPQADTPPTVYKILAYDPTMQSINIAETTSIVPDASTPLTPAEVLLRLSNPSKFFPHFAPLQAQGFEIVSGSGDVLVFRKVRNVAPSPEPETPTTATPEPAPAPPATPEPNDPAKSSTVNPIDMTGTRPFSPASANFASPTGYVNYDLPTLGYGRDPSNLPPPPTPAEQRFQSGINVRREEPVFSGGRYNQWEPRKKRGLGRRMLIGAGWVAGVSYALGVVGEYFKTGGVDGEGPKGL